MQASDKHGFEGDGFAYLKSPVWWSGIITCAHTPPPVFDDLLPANASCSGCWRDRQFCRICIRSGHSSYTPRSTQRPYRVSGRALTLRVLRTVTDLTVIVRSSARISSTKDSAYWGNLDALWPSWVL